MKSHPKQTKSKIESEQLIKHLDLPKDIFYGMPLLSLEGNQALCIMNHRGIVQYCPETIVIAAKSYHIRISGRNLSISRFSSDLIEITGYMESLVFVI